MSYSILPGRQKIIAPKPVAQRSSVQANQRANPLTNRIVQKVQGAGPLSGADVLALQRTVGNRAVQRMLQNQNATQERGETISRTLPTEVRAKMERSFGTSFGDVRIHQGPQADAMDARAYAQGSDIYIQRSINLNSYDGQKVLAHELAHVVQQRTGRVAASHNGPAINDSPQLETEAQRAANKAANGASAGLLVGKSASAVQRAPDNVIQRWPKWMKKIGKGIKKVFSGGKSNKDRGEQETGKTSNISYIRLEEEVSKMMEANTLDGPMINGIFKILKPAPPKHYSDEEKAARERVKQMLGAVSESRGDYYMSLVGL